MKYIISILTFFLTTKVLGQATATKYFFEAPLHSFLAFPIKTLLINSGSSGCFHGYKDEIRYKNEDNSMLKATTVTTFGFKEKKSSNFRNKIAIDDLTKILNDINSNPSKIPAFKDFDITKKDKKIYLNLVDNTLNNAKEDFFGGKKKINKNFYYSVPKLLDTLNDAILESVLNQNENMMSTTRNWFEIKIINQNNDTLNIARLYYQEPYPWNLPWKFEYKEQHFDCYNINFSKLINSCIPKDFRDKDVFNNKNLIMKVADYLWNKEE